jgi:organic hydroperoxide reductase OsmC/OhrA
MEKHQYNATLTWEKDRKGLLCSPEIKIDNCGNPGCIEVATPPEFPKGMPNIWSPEHLFTASVSSCLMTTFLAIAENSKLRFSSFSCDATGILAPEEGKYAMTEIILTPTVTVYDAKDRDRAERIIQKSEAACLITNSVKSKVSLNITVKVLQE